MAKTIAIGNQKGGVGKSKAVLYPSDHGFLVDAVIGILDRDTNTRYTTLSWYWHPLTGIPIKNSRVRRRNFNV